MGFEPGRIVLVAFPYTDRTSTKMRPALVVSCRAFHSGDDFVCVAISSRKSPDGVEILSTEAWFGATGLRCDSTVKWTKIMTLSRAIVMRQIGHVPDELLKRIQGLIRGIFS